MTTGTIQYDRQAMSREIRKMYDDYSHAITTLDIDHRLIHDGMAFHMSGIIPALASGATDIFMMRTPAASALPAPIHMVGVFLSMEDTPVDIITYEAPTLSAPGTLLTNVFNQNRTSSRTNKMDVYANPTVTDNGSTLHSRYMPAGGSQGAHLVGSAAPAMGEEWVLAYETDYIMTITNNTASPIKYAYELAWLEIDYPDKFRDLSQK